MDNKAKEIAETQASALKERISQLSGDHLALLFREARTHNAWQKRSVSKALLRDLFDLMIMGPTSANCLPARYRFIQSAEAKQRLKPHLSPGNVDKTMLAPVTAIVAYDLEFYTYMERNFPVAPQMGQTFADDSSLAQIAAMRNGSLQGGYFILAARSLGLDCGPMSGFNNEGVDGEFFSGTMIKSNFLCNLGYGDVSGVWPRSPRFAFDEVCEIL